MSFNKCCLCDKPATQKLDEEKSVCGNCYAALIKQALKKDFRFKLGRNQPCHCGSGKKYKRCCLYEAVA